MKHTSRKLVRRVFALVLAMAMVASLLAIRISADTADFSAPEKAMTVDKNLITVSAHSQAFLLPELLGLTNTTARVDELPDGFETNDNNNASLCSLNEAKKKAVLGVFGSNLNENPNPFLYNYFYNCYATENGLELAPVKEFTMSKGIPAGTSPANAATGAGYDGVTPVSIALKQDILIGCGNRTTVDGVEKTGYTDVIAAYNAASGDTYAPYEVDYAMARTTDFLKDLYVTADVAKEVHNKTGHTWRYSDPMVIASDVEKYVKGLQSYVLKRLKEDNKSMPVVAIVDPTYTAQLRSAEKDPLAKNEWVVNTKDCSTHTTTIYNRAAETIADTTINLVDALGIKDSAIRHGEPFRGMANDYYVVTSDQLAEAADIIIFGRVMGGTHEESLPKELKSFRHDLSSTLSDAKKATLSKKVDEMDMMTSAFDCVGSLGANSVENLLGMVYYTAYVYPEYLNQFEVAAYWYQNFYHISNLNKLKSTMASNFATSSVRDESLSVNKMSYDKAAVEAKIIEGMNYYENHRDEFAGKLIDTNGSCSEDEQKDLPEEARHWQIDWTVGIGEGQRQEENPVEPATKLNGVVKGPDGKWGYYVDDVLQTNYTGIKDNDLGWWRIENGLVNFNATGVYQNEYGWWRVENGKVNFKANGIYKNDYGWWKTTNGKVTFKETGVFKNEYGWWRVEKSKVNFKANGIYKNDYGWWKTTKGKVTFKETGVFKNDYGWWRVEKSKVNFKANGLYKNEYGTWYVKNGKVDFKYNGKYQGKTIKNGKVV